MRTIDLLPGLKFRALRVQDQAIEIEHHRSDHMAPHPTHASQSIKISFPSSRQRVARPRALQGGRGTSRRPLPGAAGRCRAGLALATPDRDPEPPIRPCYRVHGRADLSPRRTGRGRWRDSIDASTLFPCAATRYLTKRLVRDNALTVA